MSVELATLKYQSYVINVATGQLPHDEAVFEALGLNRKIRSAWFKLQSVQPKAYRTIGEVRDAIAFFQAEYDSARAGDTQAEMDKVTLIGKVVELVRQAHAMVDRVQQLKAHDTTHRHEESPNRQLVIMGIERSLENASAILSLVIETLPEGARDTVKAVLSRIENKDKIDITNLGKMEVPEADKLSLPEADKLLIQCYELEQVLKSPDR